MTVLSFRELTLGSRAAAQSKVRRSWQCPRRESPALWISEFSVHESKSSQSWDIISGEKWVGLYERRSKI